MARSQMTNGDDKFPAATSAVVMASRAPGYQTKPDDLVMIKRHIRQLEPAGEADEAMLDRVSRGVDKFAAGTFHSQLGSGEPVAISAWEDVAKSHPSHLTKLLPQTEKGADGIADMLASKDPRAITNWLHAASIVGPPKVAANVAEVLKDRIGETSEQWASMRASMWVRLLTYVEDEDANSMPGAIANGITKFMSGRGSSMSSVLFSDLEKVEMRRFANTVRMSQTRDEDTQPRYLITQAQGALRPIAAKITAAFGGAMDSSWLDIFVAALSKPPSNETAQPGSLQ